MTVILNHLNFWIKRKYCTLKPFKYIYIGGTLHCKFPNHGGFLTKARRFRPRWEQTLHQQVSPHDMWHVKCDTWYVTRDTWHITHDRWREVNPLSKFNLPSSYGLGVKVFWRYFNKWWIADLINVCRTTPATPGLLTICRW